MWCVDGIIVRAYRSAAGAVDSVGKKRDNQALGRSQGGNGTKLHIMTDSKGIPLAITATPGQSHEAKEFPNMMKHAQLRAIVQNVAANTLGSGTWRAITTTGAANIRIQNNATDLINTIGASATVELSGANSNFTVRSSGIAIDTTLNNVAGSLILRDGRTMNLSAGLSNSGVILLDGTLTSLTVNGDYTQSGRSLGLMDGATIDLNGTMNDFTGGMVFGNGTINGNVVNSSSLFAPGLSPGELEITGDYMQDILGTLSIEIGGLLQGVSYDHLLVGGDANNLDGDLIVSLWGGFTPDPSDTFVILSANSLSGMFANASTTVNVVGGGFFDVTYTSNSVILSNFNAIPEPTLAGTLWIGLAYLMARGRQRRRDR